VLREAARGRVFARSNLRTERALHISGALRP
jgi:hypothetical protein